MFEPMRHPESELLDPASFVGRFFEGARNPHFHHVHVHDDIAPPVDIVETPREWLVTAECPGLARESVSVSVEGDSVKLSGEKRVPEVDPDLYYRAERVFGKFVRSFVLPDGVDRSGIQAMYRDGILEVTIPKSPASLPRKVEIKTE